MQVSQVCITFNRSEGQIFMHFLCQTFRKSIGGSCICTVHHIGAQYNMLTLAPQCTAFIFWGLLSFYLPFSSPPFHSFSFLSLVFSYFPVSCLLSTFPLFIFPASTFLLHSLFLSPIFYSHYFLVCPNFVRLCTPPLFLEFSLWLATFLGFFTAFVTLPEVCGRQDPGNVAALVFLFHVLYMIHLPGKKAYGDPCKSGSCGGACLSRSVCFEDIKWGSAFKLCTAKFTTWVTAACPLLCKLNVEDVCFLYLIFVTRLRRMLANRVLCVPCLTLLVDQQGTA